MAKNHQNTREVLTDREVHAAADKVKADLAEGADVAVARGDEPTPVASANPFSARKAVFARANAKADAESVGFEEGAEHPAAAEPPVTAEPKPVAKKVPARAAEPVANVDDYVMVQTASGTLSVRKADIERAGGPELYVAQRVLDDGRVALERERVALEKQRAEVEEMRRDAAGQGRVPADNPAGSTADGPTGAGERESDAARIAEQLYSGDLDDAKRGVSVLVDRLNRQEQEIRALRNPRAKPVQTQVDPLVAATNRAIDEMSLREYADVCSDDPARAASLQKYYQLVRDPRNRDRRAIDIARDALEWGRTTFFNPRKAIAESKRGLAPTASATAAVAHSDDEGEPAKAAEVVARMSDFRNFGRRVGNK